MKKVFFPALLAILWLSLVCQVFSQQTRLSLSEGRQAVNRLGPNLWLDVHMANEFLVGSISFKVKTTYSHGSLKSAVIPARPVNADNSTDPTKWTMDTTSLSDSVCRFLIIADQGGNYYAKSAVSRKIMEFFIKFYEEIPLYGVINVLFYDVNIKGVDAEQNIINLEAPNAAIAIDLGKEPPDYVGDSVRVRFVPLIDRLDETCQLRLAYRSKYGLTKLNFILALPMDLSAPTVALTHVRPGRQATIGLISSHDGFHHYKVEISAPLNEVYHASPDNYSDVAIIAFHIKNVYGAQEIRASNFSAGFDDQALKIAPQLNFFVDLGDAPPPTKIFYYLVNFLVDRQALKAQLDFFYIGLGLDTLRFVVQLPPKTILSGAQFTSGITGICDIKDMGNNRHAVSLVLAQPLDSVNFSRKFLSLLLNFTSEVRGQQVIYLNDFYARLKRQTITVTGATSLYVDFGESQNPMVKYEIVKSNNWINDVAHLRINRSGLLKLLWLMDNITETTEKINFQLSLPDYMMLYDIVPLTADGLKDNGKRVLIQKVGVNAYSVSYAAMEGASILPPNKVGNNPRPIMRLEIYFSDLPPGQLIMPIEQIVANNPQGRQINETTSLIWQIDFLSEYYPYFIKGDMQQFGDGKLTMADLDLLSAVLAGEVTPSLYQQWAADLNRDGLINSLDWQLLRNLLQVTGVHDELSVKNYLVRGRQIDYWLTEEAVAELSLYDAAGRLIIYQTQQQTVGSFDLRNLPSGCYVFILNNRIGKIVL